MERIISYLECFNAQAYEIKKLTNEHDEYVNDNLKIIKKVLEKEIDNLQKKVIIK